MDSKASTELREFIRERRTDLGLTQAELADIIGVGKQAVGDWERGRTNISFEDACELANYFEISLDELGGRVPRRHYGAVERHLMRGILGGKYSEDADGSTGTSGAIVTTSTRAGLYEAAPLLTVEFLRDLEKLHPETRGQIFSLIHKLANK